MLWGIPDCLRFHSDISLVFGWYKPLHLIYVIINLIGWVVCGQACETTALIEGI